MLDFKSHHKLIEQVAQHEGYRKNMYKCPEGYNTIGYGLNLDAGLDGELARHILEYQLNNIEKRCEAEFSWFNRKHMTGPRKAAVIEMIFNIGLSGFKKFKKTIAYMESDDYWLAADEMLDSRWARQVGKRAERISEQVRTGEWEK